MYWYFKLVGLDALINRIKYKFTFIYLFIYLLLLVVDCERQSFKLQEAKLRLASRQEHDKKPLSQGRINQAILTGTS